MLNQNIQQHVLKQKQLALSLPERHQKLEQQYASPYYVKLKAALKQLISTRLNMLSSQQKLALLLVDIQNDFIFEGFALYAPKGELVILSNIALLDAMIDIQAKTNIADRLEIITSQDAHQIKREVDHVDTLLLKQLYSLNMAEEILNKEQQELKPLNPEAGQFGLHCIIGTAGVAIALPLQKRLANLMAKGVQCHPFAKLNFSGPNSGLRLKQNFPLDNPTLIDEKMGIFETSSAQTYLDYFEGQKFKEILISGICGDICVQQAAEGLKATLKDSSQVSVIDTCVHYLAYSNQEYLATKANTLQSYQTKGINYLTLPEFSQNLL